MKAAFVASLMSIVMVAGGYACAHHAVMAQSLCLWTRVALSLVAVVLGFNGSVGLLLAWKVRQ